MADGEEITHEPTRRLFAKSIKKDADGYLIHIGRETKRIHVEDTAYFVTGVTGNREAGYRLSLSDETSEGLDPITLVYKPGRLTCLINREGTKEEAKFLAVPYYELLSHLEEDQSSYFLTFGPRNKPVKVLLSSK